MRLFRLAPLLLIACTPSQAPSEGPVSTVQVVAARGLHLSENPLSLPEGALTQADNVTIDAPGLIETVRGTESLTALSDTSPVQAWTDFGGAVLAMRENGKLARLSGGVWTDYAGTYAPATGYRTRFAEEGKALYFTSAAGLWKLDALAGTPVLAGGAKAIDGSAALVSGGLLPEGASVAYRFVWGVRDANNRLVLGAVSGRTVINNPTGSGADKDVALTVPIPEDVTASHFLQVYRGGATSAGTPDDEMRQVYEAVPTAAELTARSLTFTDVVPESLRNGPNLYTNPNSGGGILATKERPPLCRDVAAFKGHLVCAATTQRQRLSLRFLTADGLTGTELLFASDDLSVFELYMGAAAEDAAALIPEFQVFTAGSPSQNTEDTARGLVRMINARAGGSLRAYYVGGEDEPPGAIMLEARAPTAPAFYARLGGTGRAEHFSPALPSRFSVASLSRTGSTVTATFLAGSEPDLKVGQEVSHPFDLTTPDFPAGTKTVTGLVGSTGFTYDEAGAASTVTFTHAWNTTQAPTYSDSADAPNGLSISATQEPDAFPPLNTLSVGGPDAIVRVVALRDSVFLLKAAGGAFRLTGDSPQTFRIEPFDTTLRLLAPHAAVALNNQVYALTNQGVVAFSDSGSPEILSIPIESALTSLQGTAASQVAAQAFAVAYESDRKYLLWLPASSADASPTQAFSYNYVTGTWTRRTDAAHSGYVSGTDDKLHLALAAGGAVRERKTRTPADYARPDGTAIPAAIAYPPQTAGAPGEGKQWREAQLFVQGAAPSALGLTFTSEATGTGPTLTLAGTLATYVTPEQMRCAQLSLGITHAVAGEALRLRGYSLTFRAYGGRGQR